MYVYIGLNKLLNDIPLTLKILVEKYPIFKLQLFFYFLYEIFKVIILYKPVCRSVCIIIPVV